MTRFTASGAGHFAQVHWSHRRDRLALRRRPSMAPQLPYDLWNSTNQLFPAWARYVSSVSVATHALSLETGGYLLWLCRQLRPACAVDYGSGFSSFVLRRYALEASHPITIRSVDDSGQWAERTREFLESEGLDSNGVVSLEDLDVAGVDLALHDLGNFASRVRALPGVVDRMHGNGLVVVDDTHVPSVHEALKRIGADAGRRSYSLRSWTLDSIGRYASLLGPTP